MRSADHSIRTTTLGDLVRALSLVFDDEEQVADTLKLLAESGSVRSDRDGQPRIRVT